MKKTVSLQISGMLFHVDEDAYVRLDDYLQSIRTHFAELADRDEIVSDIESRIAETFSEKLKKSKQTVTLKDVEALIATMGTIEDFEAFEGEADDGAKKTETNTSTKNVPRRFYRNPDDKVIAGVASGIAAYFGIDPVLIRVIFVVFGFVNGIGVIAYIILWIAMPLAKTHSERMEMQGEPMTLTGLEKKIRRSTQTYETENFASVYGRGGLRLFIREGKECSVSARGSAQGLKATDVQVINGQLRIDPFQGSWTSWIFHGFQRLSFDITLPDLQEVDVSGGCSVDIDGFKGKDMRLKAVGASALRASVQAQNLSIHVEGASSATIHGSGDVIDATAIGASSLNARAFKALKGHADISGASSAHLQATETVDGQANGASSLCVYGSPVVTAKASGASSVKNKDAKEVDTKEWHQDDAFIEHKKYTTYSPMHRFFRVIWHIIRTILLTVIRIIGGVMSTAAGIVLIFLIIALIHIIRTGFIPYLDIGPLTAGDPLGYLTLAVASVIVLVPLIFVFQVGASLIHLRSRFSVAGVITLFVLWIVTVAGAAFSSGILFPEFRTPTEPMVSRTFGAQDFNALSVTTHDEVTIRHGTGFRVSAWGPEEEIDRVHLVKKDSTLHIERSPRSTLCFACRNQRLQFSITVPSLRAIHTGGLARVGIMNFTGAQLILESKDLSRVIIDGKADTATFISKDLSRIEAGNLEVANAMVDLQDLSRTELTATHWIGGTMKDLSRLVIWGKPENAVTEDDLSSIHQREAREFTPFY